MKPRLLQRLGFSFLLMLKETHKKIYSLKLEHAPATKSTVDYNYYLSPRPHPVLLNEDLPINSTGEAEKKTKFNLSTTNKGTELKLS